MAYPHYNEIELPLLRFIYDHNGDVPARDTYRPMGIYFGLSDSDMERTLDQVHGHGGKRSKWANMVQWARNNLAKANLIERPTSDDRGRWILTEQGKKKAEGIDPTKFFIEYPDEVPNTVIEGAKKQVLVNIYERRPTARAKCVDHWGHSCSVCDFDFYKHYGDRGKEYIHVHHTKPLGEIGEAYELDPVHDLRPVCPNCHAMIHKTNPACSIEELKAIIESVEVKAATCV